MNSKISRLRYLKHPLGDYFAFPYNASYLKLPPTYNLVLWHNGSDASVVNSSSFVSEMSSANPITSSKGRTVRVSS